MMIRRALFITAALLPVYFGCSQQAGNPPQSMPPDIVAERCEVCHTDVPPRDSATELLIHYRHFKYTTRAKRCDVCHLNYDTLTGWHHGPEHRDGMFEPSTDTAQKVCKACHDYRDCWRCHNSPDTEEYHPAARRVHSVHYDTLQYACDSCHKGYDPFSSIAPPHHDNGTVEVKFGIGLQGMGARYDSADSTCYNIYCHGMGIVGGKQAIRYSERMNRSDSTRCSFCHDIEKLRTLGETHRKQGHVELFNGCQNCHPGYSVHSMATMDSTHMNGVVDHFPPEKCNECHDAEHQLPVPSR